MTARAQDEWKCGRLNLGVSQRERTPSSRNACHATVAFLVPQTQNSLPDNVGRRTRDVGRGRGLLDVRRWTWEVGAAGIKNVREVTSDHVQDVKGCQIRDVRDSKDVKDDLNKMGHEGERKKTKLVQTDTWVLRHLPAGNLIEQ